MSIRKTVIVFVKLCSHSLGIFGQMFERHNCKTKNKPGNKNRLIIDLHSERLEDNDNHLRVCQGAGASFTRNIILMWWFATGSAIKNLKESKIIVCIH